MDGHTTCCGRLSQLHTQLSKMIALELMAMQSAMSMVMASPMCICRARKVTVVALSFC